jgi:hypothetical protein
VADAPLNDSRDRAARSLLRGLKSTSIVPLTAGLLLVVIAYATLHVLVAAGVLAVIPEGYVLRRPDDSWGHVSREVAKLKRDRPEGEPVILIGGSSANECYDDPASLEEAVNAQRRERVSVAGLTSRDLSWTEALAIADNLPEAHGLVVLFVSPYTFTLAWERSEGQVRGKPLLLASGSLRRVMKERFDSSSLDPTISKGVLDYLASYAKQHLLRGYSLPSTYERRIFAPGYQLTPAAKRIAAERPLLTPTFDAWLFDRYCQLMLETIRAAQSRGYQVVLVESPLNLEVVSEPWADPLGQYRAACSAAATATGVAYVDLSSTAGLHDADFIDLSHLNEKGRARYQPMLAWGISTLLEGGDLESEQPHGELAPD